MLDYMSLEQLAQTAEEECLSHGMLVLQDQAEQMETDQNAILHTMDEQLKVMEQAAEKGHARDIRSASGLTGGDAFKMHLHTENNAALCGSFCAQAITTAMAVAEYNAAMGRIVACPTAGSCGILPGAVLTMMKLKNVSRSKAWLGLMCAGGIGMVIANKASLSGAAGGCQAECGSASAMAAAAIVEMSGGSPRMALEAAAMALKNQMGLVCDPVAGLVEVPCIKRNAGGVMIAITAAEMALAGIRSAIPVDEVIEAMREVGDSLPASLRETAQGGIAATPTGRKLAREIFDKGENK